MMIILIFAFYCTHAKDKMLFEGLNFQKLLFAEFTRFEAS